MIPPQLLDKTWSKIRSQKEPDDIALKAAGWGIWKDVTSKEEIFIYRSVDKKIHAALK